MKKFKDESNKIYAFESTEEMQEVIAKNPRFAGVNLTPVTDEEADAILNPPLTPEQQMEKLVSDATSLVERMIQKVIDDYNEAHNLVFKDVDSLDKYTRNPNYPHYQFCVDVLDWVTSESGIWATARNIQQEVMDGTREIPTEQEFVGLLPAYSGVV